MGYITDTHEKIGCLRGEIIVNTVAGEFSIPAGQMLLFNEGRWEVKPLVKESFEKAETASTSTDSYMRETMQPDTHEEIVEEQVIQDRVIEEEAVEPQRQIGQDIAY